MIFYKGLLTLYHRRTVKDIIFQVYRYRYNVSSIELSMKIHKKTTGKPIKLTICFLPVLLRVFFFGNDQLSDVLKQSKLYQEIKEFHKF